MHQKAPPTNLLAFVACMALALPSPANAYLDPASGSIVLQAILGGVAGIALLVKLYWHRLLLLLGVRKPEHDSSEPSASDP